MTEIIGIQIDDAPQIPGLTFRGFRGDADFPVMADIINGANQADNEPEVTKAEDIQRNYSHLQRSNTDTDLLFIEIDGEPVGYGRCMWAEEIEGNYLYSFFIHMKAEGRGKGISVPVANYFMGRLTEMSADHPADAPKFFQTWSAAHLPWWNDVVENLDFSPSHYGISMQRTCSQPVEVLPLPDGIEVRQPTPEHYRAIWEADKEAFRDHRGFVEPTEKDYEAFLDFPYFQPEIWKIAWEGDEIVGMVRNFINHDENKDHNRQRGYTEFISVRRPWRRQGIAKALLTQSIQMFIDMGMEDTALGVDTENPSGALKLYKDVGYIEDKRYITHRKPMK